MSKRIIAIDCDDVIVLSAPAILEYYQEKYGIKVSQDSLYTRGQNAWGVDDDTAIERVNEFLKTDTYQLLKPLDEAIEVIGRLSKQHELHVVTGRSDFLAEATQNILGQYFPDTFRSIEFTNFFSSNSRTKLQVCQELGADLLIDDHLHHAAIVAEHGIEAYLFGNYPWNQANTLPHNMVRVRSWHEVANRLLR